MQRGGRVREYVSREAKQIFVAAIGALLFALAYRWFIVPGGLYSGGFTGISQLLSLLFKYLFNDVIPEGADLTGIIYWCLNIPIIGISWRAIGGSFFIRTIICVCIQSLAMILIPAPKEMLFSDPVINSVIGGMICGCGIGLALRSGGSSGGTDIIGMYASKEYPSFSVGRINIIFNAFIYIFAAFRNDINIAAYSLLFSAAESLIIDRTHIQNINTGALVISKNPDLGSLICKELKRGVTCWKGIGEYSKQETFIYFVITNKYEEYRLRKIVYKEDKHAFTTIVSPDQVLGNFEKRLEVP